MVALVGMPLPAARELGSELSGASVCTRTRAAENLLAFQRPDKGQRRTRTVSQAPASSPHTLGAALERDRLEHRVSRVAGVIAGLRQHETEHRRQLTEPPRHIRRAIADFEAQIAAMNARLRDLARDRLSTPGPERSDTDDNVH